MRNDKAKAYSPQMTATHTKAYKYYLKGLTAKEIGILLNLSSRTIQRITKDCNFKEMSNPKAITEKINECRAKGLSYSETAKALKMSRSTVYNHLTKAKAKE